MTTVMLPRTSREDARRVLCRALSQDTYAHIPFPIRFFSYRSVSFPRKDFRASSSVSSWGDCNSVTSALSTSILKPAARFDSDRILRFLSLAFLNRLAVKKRVVLSRNVTANVRVRDGKGDEFRSSLSFRLRSTIYFSISTRTYE